VCVHVLGLFCGVFGSVWCFSLLFFLFFSLSFFFSFLGEWEAKRVLCGGSSLSGVFDCNESLRRGL
jgi:hypothetical protein